MQGQAPSSQGRSWAGDSIRATLTASWGSQPLRYREEKLFLGSQLQFERFAWEVVEVLLTACIASGHRGWWDSRSPSSVCTELWIITRKLSVSKVDVVYNYATH